MQRWYRVDEFLMFYYSYIYTLVLFAGTKFFVFGPIRRHIKRYIVPTKISHLKVALFLDYNN